MSTEEIDKRVAQVIDQNAERFVAISREIWENPEIGFQEYRAQRLLAEPLQEAGFVVEKGLAGMETAFRATWSGASRGPTIAFLCEYDALKGLGHACGHNLIGTGGMLAGWTIRQVWPDLPGKIQVIGTPAEEGGGGKIIMTEKGIFDQVDAALMFHPTSGANIVHRGALAAQEIWMTFHGRPAHAAGGPWNGLNALDALIQTFVNVALLRQQLKPDARLHGIVTKGGEAVNVIPELTQAEFLVRATEVAYLEEIKEKVRNCARAGALATGTSVQFEEGLLYANRINNMVMARTFQRHLEELGVVVEEPDPKGGVGSSDVGNVSRVCPAIHPYVSIAPPGVPGHTEEFRLASGSPAGFAGMLNAAKALAMTAADLLGQPGLLESAKAEFRQTLAQDK
ncbi:MAG: M20 family metallopeptidase [Firmicutes bacterium]|nr:M20 family metallopeptidase [Bacillota bacterium]MCL5038745.1 M20 family metallopeptidase [Bacillota bacterium]